MSVYGNSILKEFNDVFVVNEIAMIKEGKVYSGRVNNQEYLILVEPTQNSNYKYDPYIKIYNNTNYRKAENVARIYLKSVEYTDHNDSKKPWKLNNKNKKDLNIIMNTEVDGKTIYSHLLDDICGYFNDEESIEIRKIPQPDFTKLGGK